MLGFYSYSCLFGSDEIFYGCHFLSIRTECKKYAGICWFSVSELETSVCGLHNSMGYAMKYDVYSVFTSMSTR
jgi:hypothetical protein